VTMGTTMSDIPRRRLGRSAVQVSELGFGTAPLGGFRGSVHERESLATLEAAWAGGVRYFDTAPFYGYGRSELRLGALLRDRNRNSFVVSTKVGRVLRPFDPERASPFHRSGGLPFDADYDYGYDATMRSVEQSLLRTGLARLDILLIHDLDAFIHRDSHALEQHYREAMSGAVRALHALRHSGVVGAIGAGLNEAATCARLLHDTDFDCVLLAGRLTLLDRSAEDEVLPICRARGIAFVAGGPFNSGILAAPHRPDVAFHYAAARSEVLMKARALEIIARDYGVPLQAAALQFALQYSEVAAVIPGAMSANEQMQILAWYHTDVPLAFWDAVAKHSISASARCAT
jgi:D-threo-aldose 1-dehydrogenase